jgi:integrase
VLFRSKRLAAAKKLLKGLLSEHEGILTAAEVAQLKGRLADYKPKKVNHTGPSRDKFLGRDEVEQLIAGTRDQTVSLVVEYFWRTGCRISEALGQLDADVHVNGHKLAKVRVLGKGSKERWVKVPKELINRIRAQFGGETYLFEHSGKPYSSTSMTSRIGLESLKVFGKQISAHAIRHSFADYLINVERRSLDVVRQMMGHSSISTTQRYLHSQPEDADWEILGAGRE